MPLRSLFRNTLWDAIPAFCGVGIVALILWTFVGFSALPWWVLTLAFVAIAWSYCWNMQCISHNFIHNPYFKNDWLNRAFGVLESLALGVPHVLYHHYHMNHHFGDNDRKGPDGTTRDWSSIYRHGQGDQPEAFWRYCLVSFFRVELGPVVRVAARHHQLPQLAVETLALGGFWATMAVVNWRYFLFFYLPSYYLGWVLSYAEGYLEHYGAMPGNDYANSVSSYNRLYNFLWFNNGYHQEHHWDPKMHWTRMKQLHEQIKPELINNHTRTLKGPHFTALIEDWLKGKGSARKKEDSIEEASGLAA
ncbi:MAG TPA: fatty acid desaturase [Gemmataceae bacterium]|nr:fatty acid desaturase [Gemmataceae bacterium]